MLFYPPTSATTLLSPLEAAFPAPRAHHGAYRKRGVSRQMVLIQHPSRLDTQIWPENGCAIRMDLLGTNLVTKLPQEQERGGRADLGVAARADRVEPGSLCLSPITLPELELGVLLMERRDGQAGLPAAAGAGAGGTESWWWMPPWPVAARPRMGRPPPR